MYLKVSSCNKAFFKASSHSATEHFTYQKSFVYVTWLDFGFFLNRHADFECKFFANKIRRSVN